VATFADWLTEVLNHGISLQTAAPELETRERNHVEKVLRAAFDLQLLSLAGPLVHFTAEVAVQACEVLARHCWFYATRPEDSAWLSDQLPEPMTASEHLSTDITLRFLPTVYRRAIARGQGDLQTTACEKLLRRYPLSGVLMNCPTGPTTPLTLDCHPGLMMLYAERLVQHPEAAWVPTSGLSREYVERAFAEIGKPIPKPLISWESQPA
jgi:hypothetical protein